MKVRFTLDTGDHITLNFARLPEVDQYGWLWVDGLGVNLVRVTRMQRYEGTTLVDFSV